MFITSNKIYFSSILFCQAFSLVYSMTVMEEPYEYIQCIRKSDRRLGETLKKHHLRSSVVTRDMGYRKLKPISAEGIDDQDDKSSGEKDCITLILCDHGDEFNHWTDDCNGKFNDECMPQRVYRVDKRRGIQQRDPFLTVAIFHLSILQGTL
jgi:hypothetical protein